MKTVSEIWNSVGIALAGIAFTLRYERNARIECAVALLVLGLGLWLQISALEWMVLILAIALVLALETVNTAIEACVDLISPDHHPLAKVAKDAAAGAVLTSVLGSIGIGLVTFGPRLWRLLLGLL